MNSPKKQFLRRAFAAAIGLMVIGSGVAVSAMPVTQDQVIVGLAAANGSFSADASRLVDGVEGAADDTSWSNAGNPWSDASYPMVAVIDLGANYELSDLWYFAGQIPSPAQARVDFGYSLTSAPDSFQPLATAAAPVYDSWSEAVPLQGQVGRYVSVSFSAAASRFNLAEVAVAGVPVGAEPPTVPLPGAEDPLVPNVIVNDEANSVNAFRLVDKIDPPGTDNGSSWENPNPWSAANYPMSVIFDLGTTYSLSGLEYFVGNISEGLDAVQFEYSGSVAGDFAPLASVSSAHQWGAWRSVDLLGEEARRVRMSFASPSNRFNISEVRFFSAGDPVGPPVVDPPVVDPPVVDPPVVGEQPQPLVPGSDVVRSHGFGHWPNAHLSPACVALHDRFWTQGPNADPSLGPQHPENRAYHTWHPALIKQDGLVCDIGHEHGWSPDRAPQEIFELSGGWPAFGYAAESAGGERHEDHVGHKVTVARFRASIGNAVGPGILYDAGFECDWLSKIHQGSHSLDAFSNHLHEYFLTMRCMDGRNANGVVDNQHVGTEFSVKIVYTYGQPNKFVEDNCTSENSGTSEQETLFDSSILTGPEGQLVPSADQVAPEGLDKPNSRGFTCASGVLWQDLVNQVKHVDLWTELVKIQDNNGDTAVEIQPYYIIKNPSRIIEGYNGAAGEQPTNVVRTIDLCYENGSLKIDRLFCNGAPEAKPAWDSAASPFNGTFRAIHFKAFSQFNSGGADAFCTDAFGRQVQDQPPCEAGNVLQRVSSYTNGLNNPNYSYDGRSGNVQGSIWNQDPNGVVRQAQPRADGGYDPFGIGFEFLIDNRDPDDDLDGQPDGANIRGVN